MGAAIAAALPYIVQYGVPLATYAIGHLVGWFHHKLTHPQPPAAGGK